MNKYLAKNAKSQIEFVKIMSNSIQNEEFF
jgi:hypothetical protein